jgi:hypothetical protein
MDDGLSHLPDVLRIAMKRRPRRARKADGEGAEARLPQNNYLAEAPKNPIGARPGNRNALKQGGFTAEARARRAGLTVRIRDLRRRVAEAVARVEEQRRRREQPDG